MTKHSCYYCEQEAIVERCPNYCHELEGCQWSMGDANAKTVMNDGFALMGMREALRYIRRVFSRPNTRAA